MTKNLDLNGLRSIVDNYDLFYIDLWGVIHNGLKLNAYAIQTEFAEWLDPTIKDHEIYSLEYLGDDD